MLGFRPSLMRFREIYVTKSERRLGLAERVTVDLFALALMVHSTAVAFDGRLRVPDVLLAAAAVGWMGGRR
jgi:hypothetical protein